MSARQKFMFDNDFSLVAVKPVKNVEPDSNPAPAPMEEEEEEIPPPPTFSEEDIANAREEGYVEGRNAALEDAQSALQNRLSAALEAVAAKFDSVFEIQKRANEETLGDAVAVACVLVRKLFPAYIKAHGLTEIEALAHETVMHVFEEPRIVLHVHEDVKSELENHLVKFAAEKGFEGRIIVAGAPAMAYGDCRIEWEHGGLSRDLSLLWKEIETIVERNMNHPLPVFDDVTNTAKASEDEDQGESEGENRIGGNASAPPNDGTFEPTKEADDDERNETNAHGGAHGDAMAGDATAPLTPPDSAPAQGEDNGR
ncbi:FliH/SctL family protein [Varunaivibrio sulfuroxidans]|uniref:Flagellar assembly protein FliH n=1 Tax=Varunaivibrio sulfuroxidans TaxID=1773489 RepID=A0A4R3JDH5_9PROT|nr:FliH/SctL family protein [Varunaivibrio sulfuroxidans]TCS63465.1 flagellar assembly protein FliH [Varunaivibrio sulfuroxidans]WES30389.1 FliH/SctL family protein [Varunaivibrio sulfuroxidans]